MPYTKQPVTSGEIISSSWGNHIQTQYDEAKADIDALKNEVAQVITLNVVAQSWATRANMASGRTAPGSALHNNRIYVAGGTVTSVTSSITNTCEEYDPVLNAWTSRASMLSTRRGFAMGAPGNGRIYAAGGLNNSGQIISSCEEYDPVGNIWVSRTSMPSAQDAISGVTPGNGMLYAIGSTGICFEYNPTSNTWLTRAAMLTARSHLGVASHNGLIYAIGGIPMTNVNEEYNPTTNTWTTRASMPTARSGCTAISSNNRIYVIGGWNGSARVGTNEEYNPATNTWTTRASMPTIRENTTSAAHNDRIYVIGGFAGVNGLPNCEEYTIPNPLILLAPLHGIVVWPNNVIAGVTRNVEYVSPVSGTVRFIGQL